MSKEDVEVVERVDSIDTQKVPSTAYIADTNGDSHHKSVAERRLVLKADLLIVPFAALIYFVAYLVSTPRSCIGVLTDPFYRTEIALAMLVLWACKSNLN